jgi:hypothetical protein
MVASDETAQPSRPLQHEVSKQSSSTSNSKVPKLLEAPHKLETKSSPLAHQPPVRPAPQPRSGLNPVSNSLSYSQSMFGVGVANDREALAAPRSKQELDKEELTTKGRKRKRLAKACSACHVSTNQLTPPCLDLKLTQYRRTSVVVMASDRAPTASSQRVPASMSMPKASRSPHRERVTLPLPQ